MIYGFRRLRVRPPMGVTSPVTLLSIISMIKHSGTPCKRFPTHERKGARILVERGHLEGLERIQAWQMIGKPDYCGSMVTGWEEMQ